MLVTKTDATHVGMPAISYYYYRCDICEVEAQSGVSYTHALPSGWHTWLKGRYAHHTCPTCKPEPGWEPYE